MANNIFYAPGASTPGPWAPQSDSSTFGAGLLQTSGFLSQGFSELGGAYAQAMAAKTQAEFQKQQYETNQRLALLQSSDALARGDRLASQAGIQAKGQIGDERASQAAQGIEVNSGSAMDVQASTAGMSAVDQATIKNNAWREAWGYRVQALDSGSRGQMASLAGDTNSTATLLTGGAKFVSSGVSAYDRYEYGPTYGRY